MSKPPTDDEIKTASKILAKLDPGFLPFSIFHQVSRLVVTSIIEIVPIRRRNGKTEILLLRREADDPIWPCQLHTPGSMLMPTDNLESAFNRILNDELGGLKASSPSYVNEFLYHTGRGVVFARVYYSEVEEEGPIGLFYDTDNLPKELVQSQMEFIPSAIEAFKARS